jgi:hypothetical protein
MQFEMAGITQWIRSAYGIGAEWDILWKLGWPLICYMVSIRPC